MKIILPIVIFLFGLMNVYAQDEYPLDPFGGIKSIKGRKTGWFHTQQLNDRWYFVTPEGNGFFSLGATHAVECLKLDELNLFERKYNRDEGALSEYFLKCFKEWGYNSSGYGPLPGMEKQIPYVEEVWTIGPRSHSAGNKSVNEDIFDPEIQARASQRIRDAITLHANNSNCLGYVFIDCPHWTVVPQRGSSYVDFMRALKPEAPGKKAYMDFLKSRYKNVKQLNNVYNLNIQKFENLLSTDLTTISPKSNENIATDDEAFLAIIADAYFKFTTRIFRKADPHHLLLGDRFMVGNPNQPGLRTPDAVLLIASKYLDVISFQPMGTQTMMKDYIDHVNTLTGKPVLFADVNTMTSRPTEGQADTQEYETSAGKHTLEYYLNVCTSKSLIGIHRCTVRDFRPWDTNYYRRGLLKADDTPYPILVDYTKQANKQVFKIVYSQADYAAGEFGTQPEGDGMAAIQPITNNCRKIDFDWLFHLGDIAQGVRSDSTNSNWRTLDLPHDWSIEGSYSQQNGSDWQSGFLPTGIGWYRKNLQWDSTWKGKIVKILFEGIYLNSDVWINGNHLGHHPNGYIGFEFDLTPFLHEGNNEICVRVDQSKPLTGRWYTGSGIYRHVWLKVKEPLHIATDGLFFLTAEVSKEKSNYQVQVAIENQTSSQEECQFLLQLMDMKGKLVGTVTMPVATPANRTAVFNLSGSMDHAMLWSPEHPHLYTLTAQLVRQSTVYDQVIQKVGFRKMEFSAVSGFKLNGTPTKIKGVCDHHTAGALGAAVPDGILLYRLKLLKEMGCNAIRTAHNPFSPIFYTICDSLGLMVMNEFLDGWDEEKALHDYGLYFEDWWQTDAEAFIRRDRNHPSVIIWSIGNEVKKPTIEVQKQLIDLFHRYDPTRPVTQGGHDPTRDMKGENLPTLLDIKGFNGDGEEIGVLEEFHKQYPSVPLLGTEIPHTYQTRGVYRTQTQWRKRDFPAMWETGQGGKLGALENRLFPIPNLSGTEVFPEEISSRYYQNGKYYPIDNKAPWSKNLYYQSSYDNASVRSSARKAWQRTRDLDYVMGQFRWGGFDYLGETNNWPSRFANFGVIDICGFPKDHYYLYQSLWTDQPMVHLLPHWTHPGKEGVKIPVVAYTNCEEVELFLNGKSLGIQKYQDEQLIWQVPYEPGTLLAVAKKRGKIAAKDAQSTAGPVAQIRLLPNKKTIIADRVDVVLVEVDLLDKNGMFCPTSDNLLDFVITGPVRLIGTDNGDPLDLSDYKTNSRRAFCGKAMLFLQSTGVKGEIEINARSENIKPGKLTIGTER